MTTSPQDAQKHYQTLHGLKRKADRAKDLDVAGALAFAMEVISSVMMGQVFVRIPGGKVRPGDLDEVVE